MISRFVGFCSAATLLLVTSAQAGGPYGLIRVGQWQGGAYTNDTTGQFSHCAAGATYVSGIFFMVGMDVTSGWTLGFLHESWRLRVGETFPIELTFDGQSKFNVFGRALSISLVQVPMPSTSSLMTQFRKSASMAAVAKGQLFQFNLDGTSQLLPSLANCVQSVRAKGIANAGDFTVRQVARPAIAPPTGGSLKADPPQTGAAELQFEALQLASNFILKSALNNPRVLSKAETPIELASVGAAWRSDEAMGFVRIMAPDGNAKGLDVAAAVVATDARECKGKFASGRTSELIDSEVVFRGFASCEDSDGARLAQYFIIPRKKGGFVMFSVISDMKSELARTVTKDERSVDFKKAALVAASQ